jgi:hypothetical protein
MKELIRRSQEYIRSMTIWDMGVLKVCLMAMGTLLGMLIPAAARKRASALALLVFVPAYLWAVGSFFRFLWQRKD